MSPISHNNYKTSLEPVKELLEKALSNYQAALSKNPSLNKPRMNLQVLEPFVRRLQNESG